LKDEEKADQEKSLKEAVITDPNFDAQYAERWPHYHDFHKKKVLGAEENYLSYLWYEAFPKFTIPWMTLTIQALNWGVYYWMLDYAERTDCEGGYYFTNWVMHKFGC